ncbi:GtrA family protein [Clostridium ganghwense]|uniref:GtrA family protein n=1 Tax=Clostridium ganghwense TaxID=312089 RepID=A0ABT4CVP3_9CLOT|nr:GtrA family protein [Clostridium ganghwense]MCY6372281.1 GtrA family protein [Clostridium ganghwense]
MSENTSILRKNLVQFITYSLIGGSNVIINFLVLNILSYLTNIYSAIDTYSKIMLYLFEIIAFIVYSLNGYHLNKKITFRANKSSYLKYTLVLGTSAFFNINIFVWLTAHNIFNFPIKLWFNLSKLTASITVGIITFLVNKFFIFKNT